MASENMGSPGIYISERELSERALQLPPDGSAFVIPTPKGRAFAPQTFTGTAELNKMYEAFGKPEPTRYGLYAAKELLINEGTATIVRVMHETGYVMKKGLIALRSGAGTASGSTLAVLHPSQLIQGDTFFSGSTVADPTNIFQSTTSSAAPTHAATFNIIISGSATVDSTFSSTAFWNGSASYQVSTSPNSDAYIRNVFGRTPNSNRDVAYMPFAFYTAISASAAAAETLSITSVDADYGTTYSHATTPWITSQKVGETTQNLFRFHTLSDGNSSNHEVKIAIQDIQPAGSVAGSTYGSFTVIVRRVDQTYIEGSILSGTDSDNSPEIVESFINVNLDKTSPNYVGRVIGDVREYYTSGGDIVRSGDYRNNSNFVRIEMDSSVEQRAVAPTLVPFGFRALYAPVPLPLSVPIAKYVTDQTINGLYSKRRAYGFDYTYADNYNYLHAIPKTNATIGINPDFLLSNFNQNRGAGTGYVGAINLNNAQTSVDSRKFVVPFQGGFDGINPNKIRKTGDGISATNVSGFDLSSQTATGFVSYQKAVDILSNANAFDIEAIYTPGVNFIQHGPIVEYIAQMCRERGDVIYFLDVAPKSTSITTAAQALSSIDNSYVAAYYPWVKMRDAGNNTDIWLPATVATATSISYNDRVGQKWSAPAGYNRGSLLNVLDIEQRLSTEQQNTLYNGRVNFIATFPKTGFAVWGQKTLRGKPAATDRVNVRRLLIATKKRVKELLSAFVFESNTNGNRIKLVNTLNPYFSSVKQRDGLTDFRVKCDDDNNPPSVIDRNVLVCNIALQPTRTAEFIDVSLDVSPTGVVGFGEDN